VSARARTVRVTATAPGLRKVVALALVLLALCGCATHVTPPAEVQAPAKVFVLDHGRHTSLVVSTPEDGLVRYAYGDWRFYAERETGIVRAIAALLWSTPAALGRRELEGPASADIVRARVPLRIETLYEIEVERERVEILRAELDAIFAEADEVRETPETHLFFAPHPRAYNLRHNSNTAIASWLERLGCETRGPALLARWAFDQPTTGETK
jgi:hypothetical protein